MSPNDALDTRFTLTSRWTVRLKYGPNGDLVPMTRTGVLRSSFASPRAAAPRITRYRGWLVEGPCAGKRRLVDIELMRQRGQQEVSVDLPLPLGESTNGVTFHRLGHQRAMVSDWDGGPLVVDLIPCDLDRDCSRMYGLPSQGMD